MWLDHITFHVWFCVILKLSRANSTRLNSSITADHHNYCKCSFFFSKCVFFSRSPKAHEAFICLSIVSCVCRIAVITRTAADSRKISKRILIIQISSSINSTSVSDRQVFRIQLLSKQKTSIFYRRTPLYYDHGKSDRKIELMRLSIFFPSSYWIGMIISVRETKLQQNKTTKKRGQ